ncbi:alpha/beta hydrolase family protein [Speluncibacter jeojiensis]|uniref:Esterase family protein n=1 Tax=Speluncibacter jeojiensis TaxID=2710754 RepID=A0A9X4M5F4_9ACTN|nr:esterase family protein [Corynebacteriales bacterium D3-21]
MSRRSLVGRTAPSKRAWAVLGAAVLAGTLATAPPALAAPAGNAAANTTAPAHATAYVDHIVKHNDRQWDMYVYSPSMDRVIKLQIIRPADTSSPRPTLYMLNGAGGGEDGANWENQTDIVKFFGDKDVNIVIPAEGIYSYYTDWIRKDPHLPKEMWQTFLTKELPPVIDSALGTDGVNSIAGLSMSAVSVLDLAIHAPGLYKGVASYSGCAQTASPLGEASVRAVVEAAGHADAQNMWGPYGGPGWIEHDPTINAAKLRGLKLYIAAGNGLPGKYENPATQHITDETPPLDQQIVIGGALEAGANVCTQVLADRLRQLNIPATINLGGDGTHSWGYWQDDMRKSWPLMAASLGLKP